MSLPPTAPDASAAEPAATTAAAIIAADDLVVLAEEDRRYLVRAEAKGGVRKIKGLGIFDPGRLVGYAWGTPIDQGTKTLRTLRPGIADITRGLARKAQIVQPKDTSRILFECDIRAGSRVIEAGIGSGALTSGLAWAVAPMGHVYTYELREDFTEWGQANLVRAGLDHLVTVKTRDIKLGADERDVDAVVLDMPDPWHAVGAAHDALRADGHLCTYNPLVSQLEQSREAMVEHGFQDLRTLELIERPWVVGERGSRPDHNFLGHTAFLTFARKA